MNSGVRTFELIPFPVPSPFYPMVCGDNAKGLSTAVQGAEVRISGLFGEAAGRGKGASGGRRWLRALRPPRSPPGCPNLIERKSDSSDEF
jgi:hypothetical protein